MWCFHFLELKAHFSQNTYIKFALLQYLKRNSLGLAFCIGMVFYNVLLCDATFYYNERMYYNQN